MEPKPDWRQGYGFQFWMAQDTDTAVTGRTGNSAWCFPNRMRSSPQPPGPENMQGILDAVWANLLPAMTAATVDPSPLADQLAARLAGLELAAFQAKRAPDSSAAAWAEGSFLPAGGSCEAQPTLTAVRLHHDGELWQLTFIEGDAAFGATVGVAGWRTNLTETGHGTTGVPLAVSGGWTDRGHVPSGGHLSWRRRTGSGSHARWPIGTFQASWRTVPLRAGPLTALRMPR